MTDNPLPASHLSALSVAAAALVHGPDGATAYSYAVAGKGTDAPTLLIDLKAASPFSYTDCNGWVNYALNSTAPLHFAVANASRLATEFNTGSQAKGTGLSLDESAQPFARAFVLAHDFAAAPTLGSGAGSGGFLRVANFADLRAGDVIAYATGQYADPTDPDLPPTSDTGHVMIVTGAAVSLGADFDPTVSTIGGPDPVADIYAVSIVDSSDVVHMQQNTSGLGIDNRPIVPDSKYYNYELSDRDRDDAPAGSDPKAGGLGTGTMYFAVDSAGAAVGFKFNEHGSWQSNQIAGSSALNGLLLTAARLDPSIDLSKLPQTSFNAQGQLEVTLMANRDTGLAGLETETISGQHGLLVDGSGLLTLNAANPDFSGGIELRGVGLALAVAGAAGTAPVTTDAGTSNSITVMAGSAVIHALGNDTVSAAEGGSVVSGGGSLLFVGAGASTVDGGSGSATISGGAGGVYKGGTSGNNIIHGAGSSTVMGGGSGDQLHGGVGDMLVAANGNTTLFGGTCDVLVDADRSFAFSGQQAVLFGSEAGQSDVVAGTGDFLLVGRGGATTVFGGTGGSTTWAGSANLTDVAGSGTGTLVVGSGETALWINQEAGKQDILAVGGAGGGSATVLGFRAGTDHFSTAGDVGVVSRSVSNGSLTVSLSDHTTITFVGVATIG
ncbi:hypothetical protein NFI95_02165 [Acetobacteraceae bacterium KSS8]|uniref:Uncharacterized protein n=1 Tax=Endosaccharibacter trunci TaxID=2812733 RepID=A0ABT1W316_9PROT|nr:hypothetical protein [Acetobacteraceae bacterium KSS8]